MRAWRQTQNVSKYMLVLAVCLVTIGVVQEGKPEDNDKAKESDDAGTGKKSTESEEKKPEVKTKITTLRANITWQATVRDLADPTEEKLKQSKKL